MEGGEEGRGHAKLYSIDFFITSSGGENLREKKRTKKDGKRTSYYETEERKKIYSNKNP